MHTKTTLGKTRVPFTRLQIDLSIDRDRAPQLEQQEYYGHESRATRLVGDSRRFMTVSFTKGSNEYRIRTWLEQVTRPDEGIVDGENRYVFFGFTENNLKAGHLLFFREGHDFTVETLKKEFGDLKAIYEESGYGKYAARLGLSFSSTIPAAEIDPEDIIEIADLRATDDSLTSNGSGIIRDSECPKISSRLSVPTDTAAFQIRHGGFKGVLTRCPDDLFDHICGCSGKKIAYRPSMRKYVGGPQVLEVQNISRPLKSGRLNIQFIVLLLTRGIPLHVFEELLQMQLDEIDNIIVDREKALECVEGELDAEGGGFFQDLYEMLLAGHDMSEPFLATLLRRFQNTSREALRKKLHIPVKASGYMLGVVDYCGVLSEGEVYINLPGKGGPQVGPVAVMRNPAYDPDSIRVLEAVNRPELKHITNCIVFAASGTHSETDRMGGGDLDGDQYYVIFNPLLIPVAQYLAGPGRRNVDMRMDAIDTFMDMRCNFLVGQISNQWTKLVGTTEQLADLRECKALDAVKSGGGLRRIKDDFMRVKKQIAMVQTTPDWENPVALLAERVPVHVPEEMEFICDPTSSCGPRLPSRVARLALDAKEIMDEYNQRLKSAIDADKENRSLGFEDEKRADAFKAEIIAEHFPAVDNILLDTRKYLLKASVWYFVGYENRKQSFAWLGARWLNYIKASAAHGTCPLAVGARSTPLVPAPRSTTAGARETSPSQPQIRTPPCPVNSPVVVAAGTNTPLAPQPIVRDDSGDTLQNTPTASTSSASVATTIRLRRTTISPTPSVMSRQSSSQNGNGSGSEHCQHKYVLRAPTALVCKCGSVSPLRN
ncbi:RNA dependent RNA polymerase-domain-containing protein [Mycena leptocephala]|nr:RNA dependent RNA polymerase-domain-containing protein [Mycena leptocephala]